MTYLFMGKSASNRMHSNEAISNRRSFCISSQKAINNEVKVIISPRDFRKIIFTQKSKT